MTLVADWNSSVNVPFQRMRQQLLDGVLQEGVVGASDLMVVQRGAGANQSVDVGTGFAWVKIDTGTRNGMGHVTNDATANVTVTASNATNPRIDRILLRWNDSSIPTGSGNVPTLEVLTGTATAGATLTNLTGATAVPNDCLLLADLLIPATSTTISNTQIRDRRPWARGAYVRIVRTAANYTTTSASLAEVDTANLKPRIECSGVPVRVKLLGTVINTVDNQLSTFQLFMDGARVEATDFSTNVPAAGGRFGGVLLEWDVLPAAGSHQFAPAFATSSNTLTLTANVNGALEMIVEEIVRQNTANNSTTSG